MKDECRASTAMIEEKTFSNAESVKSGRSSMYELTETDSIRLAVPTKIPGFVTLKELVACHHRCDIHLAESGSQSCDMCMLL